MIETEADMVVFGKTDWEQDGNLLNSFGTRRNNSQLQVTHNSSSTYMEERFWSGTTTKFYSGDESIN